MDEGIGIPDETVFATTHRSVGDFNPGFNTTSLSSTYSLEIVPTTSVKSCRMVIVTGSGGGGVPSDHT